MTRPTETRGEPSSDIPSSYSRLIARELGLTSRQLPKLLQGTSLSAPQLLSEDGLITPVQQMQILRNALALSDQPGFGLRLGKRLTPATHGAMGFAASSSPNLLRALRTIQTFLPTRTSVIDLHMQEVDDHLECKLTFQVSLDDELLSCVAELMLLSWPKAASAKPDRSEPPPLI